MINYALFLVTLSNRHISALFKDQWEGMSPWWSALFIGFLLLNGIMRAIYEERKKVLEELYQLKNQVDKNDNYMPLSEAVEKLRELELLQSGQSLNSMIEMLNPDKVFDRIARELSYQVDIYGKQPSSSFDNWVEVNEYVPNAKFKRRASELHLKNYYNRGPEFVDLAIKKDVFERVISGRI